MAPHSPSSDAPPQERPSTPSPEGGGGLPRRRTKTPPGVPIQPSPSLETTRSILRAAGQEGKTLHEAVADLVMDEAANTLRHLRQALDAANDRATAYQTAWELAEKHNKLLQDERRDGQRAHADLLSLLSIVQTVDDRLTPSDRAQVDSITRRWVKEGGQ